MDVCDGAIQGNISALGCILKLQTTVIKYQKLFKIPKFFNNKKLILI